MKVLEEGFDAVPDYPGRRYMTNYFTIALQGDDYGSVLDVCERYLTGQKAGYLKRNQTGCFSKN